MVISASQDAIAEATDGRPVTTRRRWRGRQRPDVVPLGDWPELVGRLLALRGVTDATSATDFLGKPGPQPACDDLPDIEIAIDRLVQATRVCESVAVYGDFDVDGITSAAQLCEALSTLGAAPTPYIPDRFSEGYGLNIPAIEALHRDGATLLVTADCGTSSIEEVARARELGKDVIILDHHTVPPELPDAIALVNPRVAGAPPGGLLELATAGLAFHVASALHATCDRPFDADAYLDVAALGTVCDMAPLVDENRRLVRAGLPEIARTRRPGLRALIDVSHTDAATLSAEDIGYRLGPRLNAAGRIAHAVREGSGLQQHHVSGACGRLGRRHHLERRAGLHVEPVGDLTDGLRGPFALVALDGVAQQHLRCTQVAEQLLDRRGIGEHIALRGDLVGGRHQPHRLGGERQCLLGRTAGGMELRLHASPAHLADDVTDTRLLARDLDGSRRCSVVVAAPVRLSQQTREPRRDRPVAHARDCVTRLGQLVHGPVGLTGQQDRKSVV